MDAGESVGGLARWKHVVIHCYRLEDDHNYRETENRLRCFSELRDLLAERVKTPLVIALGQNEHSMQNLAC